MREIGRNGGEFGVATVGVPAGVARLRTQILFPPDTELAASAGVPKPCDTDPVTDLEIAIGIRTRCDDLADGLVSRRHPRLVDRQVTLCDVQIGAAHTAGVHGDKKLTGTGARHSDVDAFQRVRVDRAWPADLPRAHPRPGRPDPLGG